MFILLPIVSLILLFSLSCSHTNNYRKSFLISLVIWGVILTIITELLGLFSLIKFGWIGTFWLLIDITLGVIYWKSYRKKYLFDFKNISNLLLFDKILLVGVALIVIVTGLIAVAAAPNHSDSMEYHLPRVVHWIQNASIAHYPTNTLFQLEQNPWSEFAIMHLQILSGSDRFANLVQWGSMVGSLVGVSLIAKQLGANQRGQILAIVFCATIPMGILQSSSTNNDYVVAFWLVCFAYFTLLTVQENLDLSKTLLLGSSLGLAILTKGTAYIYAFPFCLWLAIWGIKNIGWRIWKPITIVLIIFLAVNLGHYTRNFLLFTSPLGSSSTGETNQEFSLVILISSVSKNLALHADIIRNLGLQKIITPTTGITEKLIKILHSFLGLDINDPRTMNPKASKFHVPGLSTYEDTAGNPLHLLLIFVAIVFLIINPKLRKQPQLVSYLLVVSAGFFLFCFLLTWSPWRCRLHLPIFVLFSAFVGVVFSKSLFSRITGFLGVILIFLSHSWVLNNSVRPILGNKSIFTTPRIEHYFRTQVFYQNPYQEVTQVVKSQKCSMIGLSLEGTSFEYPLWVLLKQTEKNIIIKNVQVKNESAKITNSQLKPCAIIAVTNYKQSKSDQIMETEDGLYKPYWSENFAQGKGKISVLIPEISPDS